MDDEHGGYTDDDDQKISNCQVSKENVCGRMTHHLATASDSDNHENITDKTDDEN